jgi:hypothetical protein
MLTAERLPDRLAFVASRPLKRASSTSCIVSSLVELREPCLERNCVPLGVCWPSPVCVGSSTKSRELRFEVILSRVIQSCSDALGLIRMTW